MLGAGAWSFFLLILLACGVMAAIGAEDSNAGFASGAAVLTFAAAVAVAIERLIELLWTLSSGSRLGGWWPLKQVKQAFDAVEAQSGQVLGEAFNSVEEELKGAMKGLAAGSEEYKRISAQLVTINKEGERLRRRLSNAQTLAPGSARLAVVRGIGLRGTEFLQSQVESAAAIGSDINKTLDEAKEVTDMALDIVEAFQTNPARRIASLMLGASLGLLTAAFMGINIFAAILDPNSGALSGRLGVLLSGVILGLGANPTHEVIKALERYKESRNPGQAVEGEATGGEVRRMVMSHAMDSGPLLNAISADPLPEGVWRPIRRIRSTE
jgi:hypothetical protein